MQTRRIFARLMAALAAAPAVAQQPQQPATPPAAAPGGAGGGRGRGAVETPEEYEKHPEGSPIPGQKWKVHDLQRPLAPKITPGLPIASAPPPSDAIVLFDGKDLSQHWIAGGGRGAAPGEPKWKIENG